MNNRFIINGIEWKIKYVNSNNDVLYRPNGTLTLGVTDRRLKTIFLSNKLEGALLKKVLTHEICHCCIFSYGIYLTLEQEEYLCDFVAKYANEILQNTEIVLEQKEKSKNQNRLTIF